MRVLYIEDNPNDAQLVARYLKTTPHDLKVVSTIEQAWDALHSPVDLVLVDVLLDQTRAGFGFVRDLREQGFQQPIIAVTALNTAQDMASCEAAGFDAVLHKPFEIGELADLIGYYAG